MKNLSNDPHTSWRNHQRIRFIKGFFTTRRLVLDLCDRFEQTGEISHETVNDLLETHLRNLKDLSHVLYRMPDDRQMVRKKQRIFDKILGEMWHELDKARDNVRILEAYSTEVEAMNHDVSRALSRLDSQIQKSARRDLPQQFRRVKRIVHQLAPLFEQILPVYRDNEVVFRSIYFYRDHFDRLCSPSTVEYIFPLLFGSVAEGYLVLIRSFLKTKHFSEAEKTLQEFRAWVSAQAALEPLLEQAESEVRSAID